MLIVDSQVHIWGPDTPERPWAQGKWSQAGQPVFGLTQLLQEMKGAGVDRVVIVPPGLEGERDDLALAAARSDPDKFAVMGKLDAEAAGSRGRVSTLRSMPGMLGLRFNFRDAHQQSVLLAGGMEWVWREAEQAGVPVYIYALHPMSHLIGAVAERHPALRITLDHLGMHPHERDAHAYRDFDQVLALAKHPNVAAKASALPCTSSDAYPYRNVHPYLRKAYGAFGPRRLFWGTDWTRMKFSSDCTYRQAVTMFTEELPWLSAEDKEWIMGRGVCEWLGWKRA